MGGPLVAYRPVANFTAISCEPRLGHHKGWTSGTPYLPVLVYYVHICLYNQPLLLLNGISGQGGVNRGVQLRPLM